MDEPAIKYGDERILVVDDEEAARDPIVNMLVRLGFRAESASSAVEALEELRKNDYTFLLTDIKMPGMDGLELIRRAKDEFPHMGTIAMTGYTREYKYIDVINAGATDFINKPFGIEELEAKVRRAIIERNIKEELNRLSITDSLTGLYNQRQFYARLKDEVTRAQRGKHKLALILFDLDKFKQYNDTRGHLAGDELLQKVGAIIDAKIRQGVDTGYRYGGDEFAIILIDADADIGHNIARRIETSIEEECELGASMGYAEFSEGMSVDDLVAEADQWLYKAKRQKKNRD